MSGAVVSEMMVRIAADTAQLRSEMAEAKRVMSSSSDAMTASLDSLKSSLMGLAAGVSLVSLAKHFVESADAMGLMEARLRTVITNSAEYVKAQHDIYAISQANNVGLLETASLYTRLYDPVQRLGGTTKEATGIVEAFAISLRVGGASTQEATAATLQFAQAMGSGKLQGDEFRSLAEASPRFMKAVAEGMNVPIEQLKKMGSEGKLAADVVGNALLKSLDKLKSESGNLPDTVGGSFTRMKNDILEAVNTINKDAHITLGVAEVYKELDRLIPAVRDQLADAFAIVGGFISDNKDGLSEVWATTRSLIADAWGLVKSFTAFLAFVGDVVVKTGLLKATLETARLIVAGIGDGFEIIGAILAKIGAQILTVVGWFDEGAKKMAKEANAAADDVFDKFASGGSRVAELQKELEKAADSTAALTSGTDKAGKTALDAGGKFAVLKNKHADLTDEQKKALESYKKLMNSINEKIALMDAENEGTGKLTETQKTSIKIAQDIENGTLKTTAAQRAAIDAALNKMGVTEREHIQMKATIAFHEDERKAREKAAEAADKEAQSIIEKVKKQVEENEKLSMTTEAYDRLELMRLKEQAVIAQQIVAQDQLLGYCNKETAAHEETLKALNDLIAARENGIHIKAAKEAADEWKKTADSISDNLTGALMRGFESGKSIGQNLMDTLTNMFKTLVLKPIINPIMNTVGSGLSSGMASVLGAAPGKSGISLSSIASWGGAAMNSLGNIGGGFNAFLSSFTGEGGIMGGIDAGFTALGAGNLGGAIGTLGPWALAAVAAISVIQSLSKHGGPKYEGGSGFQINSANGWNRGDTTAAQTLADAVKAQYGAAATGLGGTADGFDAGVFFARDPQGTAQTQLQVQAGMNGVSVYNRANSNGFENVGRSDAEFQAAFAEASTRAMLAGLQHANLDKTIHDYLNQIDAATASTDTINSMVKLATAAKTMSEAVKGAGSVFGVLGDLSVEARNNLAGLTGGLDAFIQKTQDYVKNFYTQNEQSGIAAADVLKQLAAVGLDASQIKSKEDFRKMVDSLDLSTDTGQKQLAALLNVEGEFAGIGDYLKTSGISLAEMAKYAPKSAVLEQLPAKQQSTTDAVQDVGDSIQTSNDLLTGINDSIKSGNGEVVAAVSDLKASVDALASSATSAAMAAESAASTASGAIESVARAVDKVALAASAPGYSYNLGN